MGDLGQGISTGISTAMGVKQMNADLDIKEAQVYQQHAETGLADQKKSSEIANGYNIQRDTEKKVVEIETARAQLDFFKKTMPYLIKQAKASGDWAQVNQAIGALRGGASAASDIKDLANPLSIKKGK